MADDEGNGFFDNWPDWAKPVVVLAGFALWIVVPLVSALKLVDHGVQSGAPVDYQPMMAVLIAMTTATIAGIFLFMTFRIDRGTRFRAEHSARDEVNKKTEDIVRGLEDKAACVRKKAKADFAKQRTEAERVLEQAKEDLDQRRRDAERVLEEAKEDLYQQYAEEVTPEAVRKHVEEAVAQGLRQHVEDVLMVDANGKIVEEYVKDRASKLDEEELTRLIGLLRDIVQSWSPSTEEESSDSGGGRASLLEWLKALFRK